MKEKILIFSTRKIIQKNKFFKILEKIVFICNIMRTLKNTKLSRLVQLEKSSEN